MAKFTVVFSILCLFSLSVLGEENETTTEGGVLSTLQTITMDPISTTEGVADVVTFTTTEAPVVEGCGSGAYYGRRRKWKSRHRNTSDSEDSVTEANVTGDDEEESDSKVNQGCVWRKRKYRRRHRQGELGGENEDGDCGRGKRRKWRTRGNASEEEHAVEETPNLGSGILVVENAAGDLEVVGTVLVVAEEAGTKTSRKKCRGCCAGSKSWRKQRKSRRKSKKWSRRKLTTPPPTDDDDYEDVIDEEVDEGNADEEVVTVAGEEEVEDVEEVEHNSVDLGRTLAA